MWKLGDGIGGKEKRVGSVNIYLECVQLVKEKEPTANGATIAVANLGVNGKKANCYAEFNMTGSNGSASYKSIIFK